MTSPLPPSQPRTTGDLQKSLADLIAESAALRRDHHAAESARRLLAKVNVGLLVLLVAMVGGLLTIAAQNYQLNKQVARTNALLADCTIPGGTCYTVSSARTGRAIGDIIRSEVYMAECARLYAGEPGGPAYDAKLEACVAARLTRPATPRTPAPSMTPAPTAPSNPEHS